MPWTELSQKAVHIGSRGIFSIRIPVPLGGLEGHPYPYRWGEGTQLGRIIGSGRAPISCSTGGDIPLVCVCGEEEEEPAAGFQVLNHSPDG